MSKRLPRKLKKFFKSSLPEKWTLFLEKRKAKKEIQESLDFIFTKNYKNTRKIIHEAMRHDK